MNEGFTANVHQYVDELRSGRNANGDVPYGGALELEAFVRMSEYGRFTVKVWAAPGDVLGVPQAYHLVAIYGGNGDVIDLCLKRSGTWEAHYALMEIKAQCDASDSVSHHVGGPADGGKSMEADRIAQSPNREVW